MTKKVPYRSESTIKQVFEDLLESYKLKNKFSESQLISSWEELMGKTIASRTTKVFIKDKKMFVELSSAPLKHELSSSRKKIIEIFEEKFGNGIISEIVFL